MAPRTTDELQTERIEATESHCHERRGWKDPELERRETLPRVTNAFAGTFLP